MVLSRIQISLPNIIHNFEKKKNKKTKKHQEVSYSRVLREAMPWMVKNAQNARVQVLSVPPLTCVII